MKKLHLTLALLLLACQLFAQEKTYTRQDTLRGTLSPLRACFDVTYYDLNLRVNPATRSISGFNAISYRATRDFNRLQIDLFANMQLDSIKSGEQKLKFTREGNAVFVDFAGTQPKGSNNTLHVFYHGAPTVAVRPPWDGGFTWTKDEQKNDWVAVSCEGIGASLWWPNKDHLSDESDSMRIYCEVPGELMCIANGNLVSTTPVTDGYKGYEWKVSYPINNYNVTLNIGKYGHFSDVFKSDKQTLPLDYYVLAYNVEAARKHFGQVKPMLACYEKYFGIYPFQRDGYALVETPYWGMEHQGAIAYGNNYKNNPWGWDFIIVHESGHEYFGNSLSVNDHADMWIHESFTTYAEAIYQEYLTDYPTAIRYLEEQKKRILNKEPMIGRYGVNYGEWSGADIYYKGTWMLHSLRSTIENDELWFKTIYEFCQKFYISQVTTEQAISFFNEKTGKDLTPIFNQYLRHTMPPTLQYYTVAKKGKLEVYYRWKAGEPGFNMPMKVKAGQGSYVKIQPSATWQKIVLDKAKAQELAFATELFYCILEKSR